MVLTKTNVEPEKCEESEAVAAAVASSTEAVVAGGSGSKRVRFGRERWRSVASSAVISCFVVLIAAGSIPESATSVKVNQLLGSATQVTGIRQHWGVFSPDPLQTEVRLAAVVYFEDGSSSGWAPPTENVFDTSRSERWRKWESRVRQDDYAGLWPVAAAFVADEFADDPRTVVKVRLVRSWTQVPLPPEPNSDRQVEEFQFYEWDHLTSTGTPLTQADQTTAEFSS